MAIGVKPLEYVVSAWCVGAIAVLVAANATGDPPDGKGGGKGGGPNTPPPDPIWVAWYDAADEAMDCDDPNPIYCPSAPTVQGMGPASECVMNGKDGAFVRSELFNTQFTFNMGWNYDFDGALEPCETCPECAVLWPTIDPAGLIPVEFPLITKVAMHTQFIDGELHIVFLMSAVPQNKALRYSTPPLLVQEVIDGPNGAFDLVIRQDAIPLTRTSGPDQDVVYGYMSIGDVHFEIWTP